MKIYRTSKMKPMFALCFQLCLAFTNTHVIMRTSCRVVSKFQCSESVLMRSWIVQIIATFRAAMAKRGVYHVRLCIMIYDMQVVKLTVSKLKQSQNKIWSRQWWGWLGELSRLFTMDDAASASGWSYWKFTLENEANQCVVTVAASCASDSLENVTLRV